MLKYSSKGDEYIDNLARDCVLVYTTAGLNEEIALKSMILTLEWQAGSWASQELLVNEINIKSFIDKIKGRSSNQKNSYMTLTRFISCG